MLVLLRVLFTGVWSLELGLVLFIVFTDRNCLGFHRKYLSFFSLIMVFNRIYISIIVGTLMIAPHSSPLPRNLEVPSALQRAINADLAVPRVCIWTWR